MQFIRETYFDVFHVVDTADSKTSLPLRRRNNTRFEESITATGVYRSFSSSAEERKRSLYVFSASFFFFFIRVDVLLIRLVVKNETTLNSFLLFIFLSREPYFRAHDRVVVGVSISLRA